MRRCVLGLTLLLSTGPIARAQDKVEIQVVKYDALAEAIKSFKGKVVVVDVWATY